MNFLLIIFLTVVGSQSLMAQKPIIPMSYSSQGIPFLGESLRDPNLKRDMITDDLAYEHLRQDLEEYQNELPTTSGLRKQELLQNIYLGHQSIVYYLEDVRSGRINVMNNYKQIASKITSARKSANRYAFSFVRNSKNNKEKARAFFHLYTNRYIITNQKSASVASLKQVRKHMNAYLKRRVDFLEAVHLVVYKNKSDAIKSIQDLIPNLPSLAAITGRLVIAKHLAGLNRRSHKIRKADSKYKKFLASAAYRSRNLSVSSRKEVLSYSIAVWRGAEGRKGSWAKQPFRIKHFADIKMVHGIVERSAIENMKANKIKTATKKYQALSRTYADSPYQDRLDLRIISLYEKRYKSHKTGVAMQKILAKYQDKYADKTNSRTLKRIHAKHRQLVNKNLTNGLAKKATNNIRNAAITTAYRYMNKFGSDADKVSMETKVAKIYDHLGYYTKAVDLYLSLRDRSSGKKALAYTDAAIKSQRQLAKWPSKAPWNGIAKARPKSRTKLLSIYEPRYVLSKSWADLAHIGLLKINLGRGEEAFQEWTALIKENKRHSYANLATGMMSIAYKRSKQWQALEDLSRLALKLKITPRFKSKNYSAYAFLGDALFQGGKVAFAGNDWPNSIKKLAEFSDSYKKDKRRAEAMYVLGQSYHNNNNHPESIQTLIVLVETYPKSKFEKPALLLGGEWSIPMAYEEQTIFFFQRFANKYSNDRKVIEIRETLASLYLGRQIYGNATRLYLAQSKDKRVSKEQRLSAAMAVMDLEERHGDQRFAKEGAKIARRLAKEDEESMALIYAFDARQAAKKNKKKTVSRIERKLARISMDSRDVRESLAQTRMILASGHDLQDDKQVYNLGLKDPKKALDKRYATFMKIKKDLDKVCEAGSSSFCAPAMMKLSDYSRKTLTAIEDISMVQTLAESEVKEFEDRKLHIISFLDQVAQESEERALDLAESGETTPLWTREVHWASDDNTDLDQTNSTSGNGYIQWAPVSELTTETADEDFGGAEW